MPRSFVRVKVNDHDQYRPGYKFSEWELKGAPLPFKKMIPKDVDAGQVVIALPLERREGEELVPWRTP